MTRLRARAARARRRSGDRDAAARWFTGLLGRPHRRGGGGRRASGARARARAVHRSRDADDRDRRGDPGDRARRHARDSQWLPIALGALVGALFLRGTRRDDRRRRARRFASRAASRSAPRVVFAAIVALLFVPRWLARRRSRCSRRSCAPARWSSAAATSCCRCCRDLVGDGLIAARDFFAGYGAVQAVPGPLFTFASFLGAANASALHGIAGALVATVAIFVPSFALIFALAPVWNRDPLAARRGGRAARRERERRRLARRRALPSRSSPRSKRTPGIAIALAAYALIAVWKFPALVIVRRASRAQRRVRPRARADIAGGHVRVSRGRPRCSASSTAWSPADFVCALAVPLLYWVLPGRERSFFGPRIDPAQRLQLAYGIFCMAMAFTDIGCRTIPHGEPCVRASGIFSHDAGAGRDDRPARAGARGRSHAARGPGGTRNKDSLKRAGRGTAFQATKDSFESAGSAFLR